MLSIYRTASSWLVHTSCCLSFLFLFAAGCGKSSDALSASASNTNADKAAVDQSSPAPTPREVLERMTAAYRNAKSYADGGQVVVQMQQDGQAVDQPQPNTVAFERPNKVRLQIPDATVISDGLQLRASIDSIPNQVLEVPAPEMLKPETLQTDGVLSERMAQEPIQLLLLLEENPLNRMGVKLDTAKLLDSEKIEDKSCYRVQVQNDEGTLVFWIDEKDSTLRRLDVPTEELRKQIESSGQPAEGLSASFMFDGATLNGQLASSVFQFEVPESAHLVKRFVAAAPPNPLSPLLGQQVGDFSLKTVGGEPVTRESLQGKVAVLDFWFTACQPCQVTMPEVDKVYEKYKDNDKVVFLAVNVDEPTIPDDKLVETTKAWGSDIPVARYSGDEAAKTFQVNGYPTLMLLGADGTLQYTNYGVDEQLSSLLDKLLAGEQVVDHVRKQYEQSLLAYNQTIELAKQEGSSIVQEIPKVEIAERNEPATLAIEQLWEAKDVGRPGNLLVVGDSIYVLDGVRRVVQFNAQGEEVARHDLKIPDSAPIFSLRSQVDGAGKRWFLGVADGQQQLFVFDDQWNLKLSFPDTADGPHDGVADAQLADFNADGVLEMVVGYWGVVGVQGVSLEGKRLWFDRSIQYVLHVAPLLPDEQGKRNVLCTSSQGALVIFNPEGKRVREIGLPYRQMQHARATDLNGDGKDDICALSAPAIGTTIAIGVSPTGQELWNHELPKGVHETGIEKIVWGPITGEGSQWVLPAPDGSIWIVDADGQLVDKFNYGSQLTGVAAAEIDGKRILLVSTPDSLKAWNVTSRAARVASRPDEAKTEKVEQPSAEAEKSDDKPEETPSETATSEESSSEPPQDETPAADEKSEDASTDSAKLSDGTIELDFGVEEK